jgi:hypothetical protein
MADIPKIAGTFKAARLTVGVEPKDMGIFIKKCLALGVQVNPTNELQDKLIRCRVTLPMDSMPAFSNQVGQYHTGLGADWIWLMCPLPKTDVVFPIWLFPIWRTVKPGGFKSAQEFRGAAKNAGVDIVQRVSFAIETRNSINTISETEVDLACTTPAELGFGIRPRRDRVYERALDFGLRPCSTEDALRLRLQYNDQPAGEELLVCSEPIADPEGGLFILVVDYFADKLRISDYHGEPATPIDLNTKLLFRIPRK